MDSSSTDDPFHQLVVRVWKSPRIPSIAVSKDVKRRLTLIMEDVASKVSVDGDAGKVARLQASHTTKDHHHHHQQGCLWPKTEHHFGEQGRRLTFETYPEWQLTIFSSPRISVLNPWISPSSPLFPVSPWFTHSQTADMTRVSDPLFWILRFPYKEKLTKVFG